MGAGDQEQRRWRDQKAVSWTLRALVLLVPFAAAITTASILSRVLPEPTTSGEALLWWVTVLGTATLVMHLTDRAARRLLPLAILMRLTLLFPDRAPSRVRVLRKAGSINRLAEAMEDARHTGEEDLAAAAERILGLAAALNVHDRRTRGHAERVRVYTDLLAEEMDLEPEERDRLRWASLLHDIGKLEVHPDILNKPGKPTDEEWDILRSHPTWGAEIVAPLAGWLGDWVLAVEEHHEKYDGTGYPKGLAGEEISLAARIVAVTDVYDVITSARSYKKPMSGEAARKELIRSAGTHFDPAVVRAFMNVSMARLRWVMGPLSWLVQLPFIGGVSRLGRDVVMFGGTAAAVATLVFTGLITPRSVSVSAEAATVPTTIAGQAPASTTNTTAAPAPTVTAAASPVPEGDTPTTTQAPSVGGNQAPRAVADSVTTAEDQPVSVDVVANDRDTDGDPLVIATYEERSASGAEVACAGTECTYEPPPDFWGWDTFEYSITDGNGTFSTAVVAVEVTSVNDAPTAVDDEVATTPDTSVIIYVLANDTDPEGESRVIVSFDETTAMGGSISCGTFCVYVPPAGFNGTDTFGYVIEDEAGNRSEASVVVAVG